MSKTTKLKKFDDGINYDAPTYKGLYLIGGTRFNPFTDEKIYLLKVGKCSNSLDRRMKDYNTHNPLMWRIDFRRTPCLETEYQKKLEKIALAKVNHAHEWYVVSREIYLEVCEKGFEFFGYKRDKKIKKTIDKV